MTAPTFETEAERLAFDKGLMLGIEGETRRISQLRRQNGQLNVRLTKAQGRADRAVRALSEGYKCPRCGWLHGDPYPIARWGPCGICEDARTLIAVGLAQVAVRTGSNGPEPTVEPADPEALAELRSVIERLPQPEHFSREAGVLKWARAWAKENGHTQPQSFDAIEGEVLAAVYAEAVAKLED